MTNWKQFDCTSRNLSKNTQPTLYHWANEDHHAMCGRSSDMYILRFAQKIKHVTCRECLQRLAQIKDKPCQKLKQPKS